MKRNFDTTMLDNGLMILGERSPHARSLAAGFFVRTGSRDEPAELNGVSHFLEHMIFKGSDRRSAAEVNLEFDRIGAEYNAFTGEEATVYYGAVLPEYQERLVGQWLEILRPSLRPDDFHREKQVILEEIAMYADRPQFRVYEIARRAFYGDHPLGRNVLGTDYSIKSLRRDAMRDYYAGRYAPDNIVAVLTGAYDWAAAVAQIRAGWAGLAPRGVTRDRRPPATHAGRRVVRDDKVQRVNLAFAMPGVAARDDRQYAARVAAVILGDAYGSRLYWHLVDAGLADVAGMDTIEEDGSGIILAYAMTDAAGAPRVAGIVREVFREAAAGGVTDAELERARRKIAVGAMTGGETPFGRLVPVGMEWLYRGEVRPLADHVDRILAVTRDEVNAFLADGRFDNPMLVALGPIDEGVDL